jgi:hypothetical protein
MLPRPVASSHKKTVTDPSGVTSLRCQKPPGIRHENIEQDAKTAFLEFEMRFIKISVVHLKV